MMMKSILIIGLIGIAVSSCLKDKTEEIIVYECTADTVSFSNNIMTEIINPSCNVTGCHDAGAAAAGFTFENYEQISTNADVIFNVISHTKGKPMPLGGDKLEHSLITKFYCWIEQGKLDN